MCWCYLTGCNLIARQLLFLTDVASSYNHAVQENIGAIGWELSDEDFQKLSNLRQHRYFTGTLAMHEDGPWRNYEELWDEKDISEPL